MASSFDPAMFLAAMQRSSPDEGMSEGVTYKTIPGADDRMTQNLIKLKEFNQREQENQMREKLARIQNSVMGAYYTTGDAKARDNSLMGLETLMRGVGALDSRDTQNRQIDSQGDIASQLNELNRYLGDRRIDSEDKRVEMVDRTAQRGQDVEERIAAGDRGSRERIQGMQNEAGRERNQSQERLTAMNVEGNYRIQQLTGDQAIELEKIVGPRRTQEIMRKIQSEERLASEDRQALQRVQALQGMAALDPKNEKLLRNLNYNLDETGPTTFSKIKRTDILELLKSLLPGADLVKMIRGE